MLIHPTVERLRALGLAAMADAFMELQNAPDAGELSREDWLGLLVDREATSRENKRLARRLREARLRQPAVVEDVDFRAHRGLDRALFRKLATCEWIREHHHLVMIGPTGIGKSWLACALGHKACREGLSVLYKRASRLFADLAQARGEGRLPRLMTALERIRLLIIDDWGPEPLNPARSHHPPRAPHRPERPLAAPPPRHRRKLRCVKARARRNVTVTIANRNPTMPRPRLGALPIYRAWLDRLPESLAGSKTADKLQAITELDLDELLAIEPPRGYGRD